MENSLRVVKVPTNKNEINGFLQIANVTVQQIYHKPLEYYFLCFVTSVPCDRLMVPGVVICTTTS